MYTVTKELGLYTFDELSPTAQDRAGRELCAVSFADAFEDVINSMLDGKFTRSKIETVYSLNDCQGDGFDIRGSFDIVDLLEIAGIPHDSNHVVLNPWRDMYEYRRTDNYTYSAWDTQAGDLSYWLAESAFFRDTDADSVADSIAKSMYELCKSIEQEGYDEIDWYYTADAHDGHVYDETGAYFGEAWDLEQKGIESTQAA